MFSNDVVVSPRHTPVLCDEVVRWLVKGHGGRYVDATLGGGGHAAALLIADHDGLLIGIDRDRQARKEAMATLAPWRDRISVVSGTFGDIAQIVKAEGWDGVDGMVVDLGVSSMHLDIALRGFSFRKSGPLDMRMDPEVGASAAEWIAKATEEEMTEVFIRFGEERWARKIAAHLCGRRQWQPFVTTDDLAGEVVNALPPHARWATRRGKGRKRIHPATRIFQAIRIKVNDELGQLAMFLAKAPELLHPGGRLVVMSYHSLEDRMIKRAFRALEGHGYHLPCRRAIRPRQEEIMVNPRARSAKLRIVERAT